MGIKNEVSFDCFRNSGLLLFVNHFLHIFGIAIVGEYDDNKIFTRMYIARVTFRGFDEKSTSAAYVKVSEYMNSNSNELLEESKS